MTHLPGPCIRQSALILALASFLPLVSLAEKVGEPHELTIERLEASPSLSGPRVSGAKLSPDGRSVTFLQGKETNFEQLDLWEFDVASANVCGAAGSFNTTGTTTARRCSFRLAATSTSCASAESRSG